MDTILRYLSGVDPEVADIIEKEERRQRDKLELIASENFVSRAVLAAQGSVLTNKYAEGYPGKRYYGGCEWVDVVEDLARNRLKELFGAEHANVQPHSGSQANMAVYFAMLKPGDTVLGMNLSHGGHLTHGSPVNISGVYFNFVEYGVDKETEVLDYEGVRLLALEHNPKMIVTGASAYPRIIDFARLRAIADEVGAYLFVDIAHIAGLVAAGLHPSPVPHAHFVTSTTHKTLRGPRGGVIMCPAEFAAKIDKAVFPGTQGGPLMHIIAAKAVAIGEALKPEFKTYQESVLNNAKALAEAFAQRGIRVVSGGTDNHLMLLDMRSKGLTGKEAEKILDAVGVTVNKNTIPFDPQGPMVTSGIRIGTPAVTTRGMGVKDMALIAEAVAIALDSPEDAARQKLAAAIVTELCSAFPLYSE